MTSTGECGRCDGPQVEARRGRAEWERRGQRTTGDVWARESRPAYELRAVDGGGNRGRGCGGEEMEAEPEGERLNGLSQTTPQGGLRWQCEWIGSRHRLWRVWGQGELWKASPGSAGLSTGMADMRIVTNSERRVLERLLRMVQRSDETTPPCRRCCGSAGPSQWDGRTTAAPLRTTQRGGNDGRRGVDYGSR